MRPRHTASEAPSSRVGGGVAPVRERNRVFCRCRLPMKHYSLGKVVRAADGAGLENQCAVTPYQEFESLTFREQCPRFPSHGGTGGILRAGPAGGRERTRVGRRRVHVARAVGRSGRMRGADGGKGRAVGRSGRMRGADGGKGRAVGRSGRMRGADAPRSAHAARPRRRGEPRSRGAGAMGDHPLGVTIRAISDPGGPAAPASAPSRRHSGRRAC